MEWFVRRATTSDAAETLRAEAIELLRMASQARHPASVEHLYRLALSCFDLAHQIEHRRGGERHSAEALAFAGGKPGHRGPEA
jgi:hypothetical protein